MTKGFKEWILEQIITWLVSNLTKEKMEEYAEQFKSILKPWLLEAKVELIAKLREEAKKSETKIDDEAVTALEHFLNALLV